MAHEQKKPVVMAVDDDPLVLRTLNRVLEAEGFGAKLCSSGRSAVEGFDKSIYTILLDITMPDMSGLDVFEKLKQKNPLIPIIFYTGLADRDKRRGIRNRCRPHAYIVKGGRSSAVILLKNLDFCIYFCHKRRFISYKKSMVEARTLKASSYAFVCVPVQILRLRR